jgi:hypothetical protein
MYPQPKQPTQQTKEQGLCYVSAVSPIAMFPWLNLALPQEQRVLQKEQPLNFAFCLPFLL